MKIELAPIDYYFYRPKLYTIQVAFEYKNKVSTQQLVDAIKKLTIKMPVIGSRLMNVSGFQIVLEVGHEIPVREQHLNKPIDFESEILFDSVSNVEGEPLIKFLVTHMKDRSYVGVSFSHMLGDGAAFFMFMENLVRIISAKHLSPVLTDRSKLIAFAKGDSTVSLFESTGYIQPRPENPTHDIVEHIHYSNGHLNELKEKLRAKGCEASTNNIIMADLAKRFYKDIPNFKNQFIIRCPVDYRKAIGLGTNYFGNAVRDAVSFFYPEELEEMELSLIVNRIRQSIISIDEHTIGQSLKALNQLRQKQGTEVFQDLGCPGLLVSNLSKFPITKIDLGSGVPTGFHHASLAPRLALVLPHHDGLMVKYKRPNLK